MVETFDKHDISLMIEAEETPQNKSAGNLKDDALFLLNDDIQSKNDEHIEKNKVDGKYEKLSSNVRNGAFLLKELLVGTLQSFQKTELDHFRFEYGVILNSSEISNGDEIDDIWNQSDDETGPGKMQKSNRIFSLLMR